MNTKIEIETLRALQDGELDLVTGGVTEGGCIRNPLLDKILNPGGQPPSDGSWTFRDVFARYTIG